MIRDILAFSFVLTIVGGLFGGIMGLIGLIFVGVFMGRVLGSLPAVAMSVGISCLAVLVLGVMGSLASGSGDVLMTTLIGVVSLAVVAGLTGVAGVYTQGSGGLY